MKPATAVFVDTGAWIALAVNADPWHERAVDVWSRLLREGRPVTSTSVLLETFTFLDRRASRADALRWWAAIEAVRPLRRLDCSAADFAAAVRELARPAWTRASFVDATSFVLMRRHGIRHVFTFDNDFAAAGFDLLA